MSGLEARPHDQYLSDPGTLAGCFSGVEQMTSARFVETLGLEALHD